MMDTVRSRLRYRCRRGMLELDALLERFLDSPRFSQLSQSQLQTFERFLEESDPQLFRWLMGREVCEEQSYQELISYIRSNESPR
jgi:antitoxin CptB